MPLSKAWMNLSAGDLMDDALEMLGVKQELAVLNLFQR